MGNKVRGNKTGENASQALQEQLARARAELGLSQAQLAQRAGISRPIVSVLEQGHGNPSLAVMQKLAMALGCEVRDLLTPLRHRVLPEKSTTSVRSLRTNRQRYSPSGRKPSFRTWLSSPPPGSKTEQAKEFGVDLTLLASTLARSPEQRLRMMAKGGTTLESLRRAKLRRSG